MVPRFRRLRRPDKPFRVPVHVPTSRNAHGSGIHRVFSRKVPQVFGESVGDFQREAGFEWIWSPKFMAGWWLDIGLNHHQWWIWWEDHQQNGNTNQHITGTFAQVFILCSKLIIPDDSTLNVEWKFLQDGFSRHQRSGFFAGHLVLDLQLK